MMGLLLPAHALLCDPVHGGGPARRALGGGVGPRVRGRDGLQGSHGDGADHGAALRRGVRGEVRSPARLQRAAALCTAVSPPPGSCWRFLIADAPRFRSAGFGTGISPWTYLLNQAVMIGTYLKLSIWPHPLVLDYGRDPADRARDGVAVLVLVVVPARRWWPRRGYAGVAALAYLGIWFFVDAGALVERRPDRDRGRRGAADVPRAGGGGRRDRPRRAGGGGALAGRQLGPPPRRGPECGAPSWPRC